MAKTPKLDDDAIAALIEQGITQSVGYTESRLSRERERVLRYYEQELPGRAHPGDMQFVSPDVYDSVESMKAQLLEVFTASTRPVEFSPLGPDDVEAARVRTDYCTDVLFNQNRGFQLFEDVITQALLARNGIVKVWWETEVKTEYLDLSEPGLDELQGYLASNPDHEVHEIELHSDGQSIKKATLKVKKNVSQVRMKSLAGEDFGISPMAENIETADLVFHRHEMTVSELLKKGYDKKLIEGLQDNERIWAAMEPEKLTRFQETDDFIGEHPMEGGQEARRTMYVYECYLELDLEGEGESQLYKVTKVGTTILDKEPCDWKPFVPFIPLPRPNAFWGHPFARMIIQTQNARSYLMRSVVNHAMVTNNPRMQVVKGALLNPRELMENRFGGLVNVTRPDGLIPLPQAGLNPFVFQTMQMLQSNKEEMTSISSLSQGLNPDALSKQNSGDMVHELITVSQLRQKVIARNFAEGFLRDLYRLIYKLVLENEDRQKIIQVAGAWTPVDFSQWPEDCNVSVAFKLGYGEAEKEAQGWLVMLKVLEGIPALAGNVTPQQQYNMVRKAMVAGGIKDIDNYLLPMNKAVPPPPDPMMQADLQVKQADAKVKQANAEAAVQNIALQREKNASEERIAMAKIQLETMKMQAQVKMHADALAHKIAVDAAELLLENESLEQGKLQGVAKAT